MHEYSIVSALIERVEAEAAARGAVRVHRIHVGIGEASGVEVALLATAYATFRERTAAAGSELQVRQIAARWACPRCAAEIPRGERLHCAACHVPARLTQGDEIVLERIEMEVPDV